MQGPMPSLTQMILPQFRQFGAVARSGWRVAKQVQRRAAVSVEEEREGLVWISRARIAESRSLRVVEAPCMEVPPETAILVVGLGELAREVVRTLGKEEMRAPAADGGGLGEAVREFGADEVIVAVGIGS